MRIAVDGRELGGRVTGVGRYLAHLLGAWDVLDEASGHEFTLYVPTERGGRVPGDETGSCEGSGTAGGTRVGGLRLSRLALSVRAVPGRGGTVWEQVSLPAALRRDRFDVLFAPAYTAPAATRLPVVLTVHDVSFLAHPEWFPPRTRLRRGVATRLSARRARRVLTVSEFSRREIVRLLGVPAEKVDVIPLGLAPIAADGWTGPTAPQRIPGGMGARPAPERGAAGAAPVVLYVGSVFNRRHVPELIRAVALVAERHPGLRLEIVGDNRTHPWQDLQEVAARSGAAAATTIRSYVPEETLADLYSRAGVFAFLSDYEGFGLTPLEALAAGVPIVVGDTPVAREVYGDAAAYVPTTDVAAIARALDRLLSDAREREALLDRAPEVLGRYSWERTGRLTLHALLEAARG